MVKYIIVPVQASPMKTDNLFDATVFDPSKPKEYVAGFKIKV